MELPHSRAQLLRGASAPRRRDGSSCVKPPSSKLTGWKVASTAKQQPPAVQAVLGRMLEDGERAVLPRSSSLESKTLIGPQVGSWKTRRTEAEVVGILAGHTIQRSQSGRAYGWFHMIKAAENLACGRRRGLVGRPLPLSIR